MQMYALKEEKRMKKKEDPLQVAVDRKASWCFPAYRDSLHKLGITTALNNINSYSGNFQKNSENFWNFPGRAGKVSIFEGNIYPWDFIIVIVI